jgi:diaminohydroxyphosphoribosylaminopyrimidine deaminase/5-amino-6-(5-phosphoribosylamino)uracil reductase
MRECLRLAEKGRGFVSPNPLVGAVMVRGGRIVARGFHRQFGGPHAEVECLRAFNGDPRGTTLYVNLEPCAHYGKTPPCTDLIIKSGIRKAVVGMTDPNPLVSGKGIRKLRAAGVRVVTGILEHDATDLNRAFTTYIKKKRPFVHLKIAQTLDGKIAFRNRSPVRITGKEARSLVHRWRAEHDAVLVGAGTIGTDDPQLTVRLVKGRDPAVVVLDGSLSVRPAARIFSRSGSRRVFILTTENGRKRHPNKYREIGLRGAQLFIEGAGVASISINRILRRLYGLGFGSILVEGGRHVFTEFLRAGAVDRFSLLVAPKLLGDDGLSAVSGRGLDSFLSAHSRFGSVKVEKVGEDILLDFLL